jgi:holliday junction DNA helicase RuvA
MISSLQGIVVFANGIDGTISVVVNGVGYLIFVGQRTGNTVQVGEEISLFIETITKETGTSLYGFDDYTKLVWFKSLLKVTGVGAKVGMNIIDSISVADITRAIIDEKPESLQVGSLGEKVANRIIAELKKEPAKNAKILVSTRLYKGKLTIVEQINTADVNENGEVIENLQSVNKNDVVSALVNLGFDYNRSFSIACGINAQTLEDAIKEALKKINAN